MLDIIELMATELEAVVIASEQKGPRPSYPFIAVKQTAAFVPDPHHPAIINTSLEEGVMRTAHSQPQMVLSVTEYATDLATAGLLAQTAHDWFSWSGYEKLKDLGFVVVDVMGIDNRDGMIVDDYERRRGFDVRLRFLHSIERFAEFIETVAAAVRLEIVELVGTFEFSSQENTIEQDPDTGFADDDQTIGGTLGELCPVSLMTENLKQRSD